jgi:hypothetical protein
VWRGQESQQVEMVDAEEGLAYQLLAVVLVEEVEEDQFWVAGLNIAPHPFRLHFPAARLQGLVVEVLALTLELEVVSADSVVDLCNGMDHTRHHLHLAPQQHLVEEQGEEELSGCPLKLDLLMAAKGVVAQLS